MDSTYNYEPKGQYYEISPQKNGIKVRPVAVPSHVREQRRKEAKERQMKQAVARNLERESRMSVRTILLYTLILFVGCGVCYLYLSLQSQVSERANNITSLKAEYNQAVSNNDIVASRLEAQSDLFKVKKEATNTLGMSQATAKQITYFSVQNQDYLLSYK